MTNPTPENTQRTDALIEALLTAKPVQPSTQFNQKTLAAIRAEDQIDTEALLDTFLVAQKVTPSPNFTEKVLIRLHEEHRPARKLLHFPNLPTWLMRTTAMAATVILCLSLWQFSGTNPVTGSKPVATLKPVSGKVPESRNIPPEPSIIAVSNAPTQATNEATLDEVLLLADGLDNARPLLDTDMFTALAVMTR